MPSKSELCNWAAAAVRDPPDPTAASNTQAVGAHISQLKRVRAAAVGPSRTWEFAIAEAAADP